jgi:putative phage-type endonuclease
MPRLTSYASLGKTFDDEADWLVWRDTVIGGSDSAMALNLSPYGTAWELFMRKKKRLPPIEMNDAMLRGKLMENVIATMYTHMTGEYVNDRQLCVVNCDHPFIGATLDGMLDDGTIVEFKSVGSRSASQWGDEGDDFFPEHYRIQVYHQLLACPSAPRAKLVADVAGEVRVYPVERDREIEQMMVEKLAEFQRRIDEDDPPEITTPDMKLVSKLFPSVEATISLGEDIQSLVDNYKELGEREKEAKEERESVKGQIVLAMADHAVAELPDGRILKRPVISAKGYTVEAKTYTKLLISSPKKGR